MANRQVWFGTEDYMTWVPAPNTGLVRGIKRYVSSTALLNGGAYGRTSTTGARTYSASWAPTRRSELAEVKGFLDGTYGNGPLYFVDPFAMGTNTLPQWLAAPYMAADDAPTFVWGARPALSDVSTNNWGYPVRGAVYNSASTVSSANFKPTTLRTNLTTNPRSAVTSGIGMAFGTGGSGTNVAVTSASDGPLVAGFSNPRITSYSRTTVNNVNTSGIQGLSSQTFISGGSGLVYSYSFYIRSSVNLSLDIYLNARNNNTAAGGGKVQDVSLVAGEWTRVGGTLTTTGTFDRIILFAQAKTTAGIPAGTVLDVTGALLERSGAVGSYFDGYSLSGFDTRYRWSGTANNSATIYESTNTGRSFRFPIPEGYKFVFGAHGTQTGTAQVTLNGETVPLLGTDTNQLTNVSATGSWAEITITGTGTLVLYGLVARIVPVAADTTQVGRFQPGEGTTGLQLANNPTVTGYSVGLNSEGISADFVEVEAWA